nr:MAG TPA: hypothetical protein [Caudoviricetes sp.]
MVNLKERSIEFIELQKSNFFSLQKANKSAYPQRRLFCFPLFLCLIPFCRC